MIKQYISIFLMISVIVALSSLGYIYYKQNRVLIPKDQYLSGSSDISVKKASAVSLSPNISSSNSTPSSTSSPINSDSNLQSNVNYNDPSVQSMTNLQSVNYGGKQ